MAHSIAQTTSTNKNYDLNAVWPDVVRDIIESNNQLVNIPELNKWLTNVLQYNIPGGKNNRALLLVHAYKTMMPKDQLTEKNIRLTIILGWCTELLHSCFVVLDDVMDRSSMRRKQPCWYRYNDLGLAAINDGIMIKQTLHMLLEKHFKGKECYIDLIELFHNITMKTIMGQSLDLKCVNSNKMPNLDIFTMDRYDNIVKYKTSYYSFVLPVIAAMHFVGVKDREMFKQAEMILLEIGHFFQIQDDYLDCFGNEDVIGKIGSDIQEGKCSWLVVIALQRVTPQQRKILEECYGHSDMEKVQRVKQLYNDLDLPNVYSTYEKETYHLINTHIQRSLRDLPHQTFRMILEKLYRRKL